MSTREQMAERFDRATAPLSTVSPFAPRRRRVRRLVAALCLIVGLGLLLYPLVGTVLNDLSFSDAVGRYDEKVSTFSEDERQEMLAAAHAYNDSLRGDPVRDPFIANSGWALPEGYSDVLNVDGKGLMGTIDIPAIGVNLPIHHGVSDEVLTSGTGHLPQTSLPVGGQGTHAVITGHTGLPTARLFTDLALLKVGDVFIVEVLDEKRAYAVDEVRVVEPDELSAINIDENHDYVTLLTCTPYGINSHRLLVRGEVCDMPTDQELSSARRPTFMDMLLLAAGLTAAVAVVSLVAWRVRRARKQL